MQSETEQELKVEPIKRKTGPKKKPLTEVGDVQARKRTNAIYESMLKECSDQNVSFDKLLVKMCLIISFT